MHPPTQETAVGIKKLILSSTAASAAELTTFPLDFIKTRLQLDRTRHRRAPLLPSLNLIRGQPLYSGVSAAILRHIPYTAIRIYTFESLRSLHPQSFPWLLLSGMTAGALGQFVAVPADVIKIRMIKEPARYTSLRTAVRLISREQQRKGLQSLWRGSLPAIQRAGLVNLGELSTYDIAKRYVGRLLSTQQQQQEEEGQEDSVMVHVMSSMCSGFVSAVVSTPADVVKTRLMSGDNEYRGVVDCLTKTVRGEGVGGLYKGFWTTWMRLGPWQLTFWVTYEQLRALSGLGGF